MKKLFLILILTGCCFTLSFAQKEKFFSLEANINTQRNIIHYNGEINYEAALIPAFTINRFKFNVGIMYSSFRYYENESVGHYNSPISNRHIFYSINIPIILNYNIYRNKYFWLNCFFGTNISNLLYSTKYDYINDTLSKIDEKDRWRILSYRLGIEVSILASNNFKVNIAPFVHLYGNLFYGVSLGIEYMFR
jgi:hypothetical protein